MESFKNINEVLFVSCIIKNCQIYWKDVTPEGCKDFTTCSFFVLELFHWCKKRGNFQKHFRYKKLSINGYEYDILVSKSFKPMCLKQPCKYYNICRMQHKNKENINRKVIFA